MSQKDNIPTIIRKYDPDKGDYAFENRLWHVLPFIKRLFQSPIDTEIARAKTRLQILEQQNNDQLEELARLQKNIRFRDKVRAAKQTSPMMLPPWHKQSPIMIDSKKIVEP